MPTRRRFVRRRASLLTGKYSARHGITSATGHLPPQPPGYNFLPEKAVANRPVILPESKNYMEPSEYTLAEALRDAGWRTAHIGKWHLGLTEPHWPDKQGFDVAVHAHPDPGPPSYFSPYGFKKFQSYADGPAGEYITDRFTDEAVKFITESKDRPFFLNLWHHGVHGPWGHKVEYTKQFAAKKDPRGEQANPIMASMLKSIDESFGRILETLDRLGLTENTIVIFNSDNGGNTHSNTQDDPEIRGAMAELKASRLADWHKWADSQPPTNNAPLRDGKGTIYEGGVRVPLMWSGPGVVGAGTTNATVVGAVDLYATVLDMVGVPRPAQQKMDGVSYAMVLRGTGKLERAAYFTFFPHGGPSKPGGVTVRAGDWKLLHLFETGPNFPSLRELYNLRDDLSETKNLADAMPDKVKELDALIDAFLTETGAIVPKPNPAYHARPAAPAPTQLGPDDGTGPIAGWKLRQCKAVTTGEGVRLEGTGRAPFLGTAKYKFTGVCEVSLRVRAPAGGPGQIHWRLAEQAEFSPERVTKFDFPAGDEWRDVKVSVPSTGSVVQLRVFLPVDKGAVELSLLDARSGAPAAIGKPRKK